MCMSNVSGPHQGDTSNGTTDAKVFVPNVLRQIDDNRTTPRGLERTERHRIRSDEEDGEEDDSDNSLSD